MKSLAGLAMVLTMLAVTVGTGGAASAFEGGSTQNGTAVLDGEAATSSGSVNLQGFAQPITPGALGPTPVQSTAASVGGVNVGALSEFGSDGGNHTVAGDRVIPGRSSNAPIGGYAAYRFSSESNPRGGYGVNLHFGSDPVNSSDSWRVQPGFDYTTSLGSSWQLSSRLFSTYNLEGASTGSRAGLAGEERGFRDVGLSLGLGYAPSESWTVQTQATYAVPLRNQDKTRSSDEGDTSNEFFGGVILNYRF